MPIDPSIYSQIQQPQIANPLNALAQVAQIQNYQNQNRLADLTYGEKQREFAGDSALAGLLTKGGKPGDVALGLAQQGYGTKSLAYTKQQNDLLKQKTDIEKTTAETAKNTLANESAKFAYVGQVMSGVRDQASYSMARQQLMKTVPDMAANIPEAYDPAALDLNMRQAMSYKDRMDQKLRELTLTETNRHNTVTEGLTLSGQNKVDARSREANNAPEYKQDADGNWVALPKKPGAGPITAQAVMGPDGKPLKANKQPNEYQGKSAGYGARAEQADKIITSLEGNYSPMAINSKVSVESTPLVGGVLGAATNKFGLSANDQRAEQAQRDFINAVLRQESGASISPSEFDNARKQYFPQPGDTKEVLTQKAQNRKLAIHGFKNAAGNASFSAPAENAPATAKFLGFE